jgi:hypothetical protein
MTFSILTCRLGDAQARVHEAALRAGLEARPWSGRCEWSSSDAPAFVVAGLGRGERRIPAEVVDVVTRVVPGAPLLLVCEEELASRTSSIHRGRVMLLGPPLSPSRLFSEMRILLARAHGRTLRRDIGTGAHIRERAAASHWTAQLEGSAADDQSSFVAEDDGSLTAVLGFDGPVRRADAARSSRILRADTTDTQRSEELRASLGSRAGVVHLGAKGDEWVLYWPNDHASILIHSPLRLPNAFQPPKHGEGAAPIVRLGTCEGDVLLALAAPLADGGFAALASEMSGGGPAVVDALARREACDGKRARGIVVEVRL